MAVRSPVLGFCFIIAGAAAVMASRAAAPEVLQAERIELVTREGVRQARFAVDSLGLTVILYDRKGQETASFRFDDEPRLTVLNESQEEVVGLGRPRPRRLTN